MRVALSSSPPLPSSLSENRYSKYSPNVQQGMMKLDHNAINYTLLVQAIAWLSNLPSPQHAAAYMNGARPQNSSSSKSNPGNMDQNPDQDTTSSAILVFLPGIKEITTLHEMLLTTTQTFRNSPAKDWVLPIHSSIPPEEQRLVFTRPPKGVRKVVLATNIAETAITIDDVAFVVDTGRMKENRYDPLKRMSSLEDCLVARTNARQRRGRAGRVRVGVAVHLYSRHRHDKIAKPSQAPEVQRVPLEQLILRIKALRYPGTAGEVCARLIEPPAEEAVKRAVDELVFLEAMTVSPEDGKEEMTPLGVHLSTLPVDCRIGKLILLGAVFGVADDALTIAATLSYRNPFQAPLLKREEADKAKMSFATAQSDHLTILSAYKQVDSMGHARYDFCRENFLSIKTLQTIAGIKRQLLELLSAAGFVRPGLRTRAVEALGRRNGGSDGVALALEQGLGYSSNSSSSSSSSSSFPPSGMPGDWECGNQHCRGSNFARNIKCFRCFRPKPTEEEKVVANAPPQFMPTTPPPSSSFPPSGMPSDWECINQHCRGINFARNIKCFRCFTPKPAEEEKIVAVANAPPQFMPTAQLAPGDWECSNQHCRGINFARNIQCFRCFKPKPVEEEKEEVVANVPPQPQPVPTTSPVKPEEDWECANHRCRARNQANNITCLRCFVPKPEVVAQPMPTTPLVHPEEDWECGNQRCREINQAINLACFRCYTPKRQEEEEEEEGEENTQPILKALLAAALFPQMVIVEDNGGKGQPTFRARPENGEKPEDMALHPSCIAGNFMKNLSSKYLVYHERVKTTRVFIRDATPVSPYALILFGGGSIEVEGGRAESVIRLDGWLGFKCPRRDHLVVMELREVLDGIMRNKIENPKSEFCGDARGIIGAVKAILEMDEDGKAVTRSRETRVEGAESSGSALARLMRSSNGGGGKGKSSSGRSRGGGRGGRGGRGGGGGGRRR